MPSRLYLIPILLSAAANASGPGIFDHDYTPSESQYSEFFSAGTLQFNGRALNFRFQEWSENRVTSITDINYDGIQDIILGNAGAYALSTLHPDMTVSYTLYTQVNNWNTNFHWTTVADLDNNGWPELIGRNSNSQNITIAWIEKNEIAETTVETMIDLPYASSASSAYIQDGVKIVHADLDNDGLPDLVFNTSQGSIVIRWSSRDKLTQYESYFSADLLADNVLYDPQDFNADGFIDILCLDTTNETFVFYAGTGTDTLATPVPFTIPISGHVANANYPYFGNLDSNPETDMVIYDETSNVNMLIPNFMQTPSTVIALIADPQAKIYAIPGDLNNSGSDDILLQHQDPNSATSAPTWITTLITDPLTTNITTSILEIGNPTQDQSSSSIVSWQPKALAVQLDQDPGKEILWLGTPYISSTGSHTDGVENIHSANFRVSSPNQEGPSYGATKLSAHADPTFILADNFDNDQTDELFIIGPGKGNLLNLAQQTNDEINQVNGASKSIVTDLGNDGTDELILSGVSTFLITFPINPDGTFATRTGYANPNGNRYIWLQSDDFDADGLPDILTIDYTASELHFFKGLPNGTLSTPVITPSIPNRGIYPCTIAANGDEYPDLVLSTSTLISIYINNTDGTFSPATSEPILAAFEPYWFETADMDQDGITDIIVASQEGVMTIYYLDENNESNELRKLSIQDSHVYLDLTIKDMNNDAYPDILTSTGSSSSIGGLDQKQAIWIRTDHREYQVQAILPAPSTEAMTLGHFNDDNILDLATAHAADASVRIHWGQEPPNPCPADLNNDNALDFFDISQFLSTTPDFNNDTNFDFFDISDYLTSYAAGCP